MQDSDVRRVRRIARTKGLRLRKLPERSRDYWQHGPFMLVDADTNGIVSRFLDLDEIEQELERR